MRIDITQILNKRAEALDFDYTFNIDETESVVTLPEEIKVTEPVSVCGSVVDKNNIMMLNAHISVKYLTQCDRCLEDIEGTVEFDIEKMISTEVPEAELLPDDDDYDETVVYVNESSVYLDSLLIEDIALELPAYHLCREDCKGLCFKCGKNLNEGICECSTKKEIDPRLKILEKLLEKEE